MQYFIVDEFFEQIVQPFFDEITVKNQFSSLQEYEKYIEQKYNQVKKEDIIALIKNQLFSIRINSFIFEKPFPSNEELSNIINRLLLVETLFNQKIVNSLDITFTEEAKDIFIYLIGIQCYLFSYRSEKIIEVNIYKETALKIIEYFENKEKEGSLTEKEKRWANFLKRSVYLVLHEVEFSLTEDFYKKCLKLIKEDIEYSRNVSLKEYMFALFSYLNFYIDNLLMSLTNNLDYLKEEVEFKNFFEEFIKLFLELRESSSYRNYKMLLVLFLKNIYELKLMLKNNIKIEEKNKINLISQCINLIKAFYGEKFDLLLFVNNDEKRSYNEILKEFSLYLSKLLNEEEKNTLDILFRIFYFLYNFPEYNKLNYAIFNRIQFISKKYYNRKILLLSNLMFLKSLNDIEKFKSSILSIKNSIEKNPVPALINFYNNEIVSMTSLPPNLINFYKADPDVILIFEKIHTVNKFVFDSISNFKKDFRNDKDFKIKFDFLLNVQNEINNLISIVSDPNLVRDLGAFYCFFIDSYIKKADMDYREDYINKANLIKYSILDLNPVNFSLTLLFSKLGKINFIIYHRNPSRLGIKKRTLTQIEKDELAGYLDISIDTLPKTEGRFNWNGIEETYRNLRKPALFDGKINLPEARTLKVLCAILNKITRQDVEISKLFLVLINESYDYTRRSWELDPLIIYYFATYFAKKGKMFFINENTGKKLEVRFTHINNPLINERINMFIKDMLESIKEADQLSQQFDEIINRNVYELVDKNGKLKNIGLLEIRDFIKNNISVKFEKPYVSISDKIYLGEVLNNYFISVGRSSLSNLLKYVIFELIENANKSNLKRVFFNDKGLDIETKYQIGMSSFIDFISQKKAEYIMQLNEKKEYKVIITIKVYNENIIISISNNFKITRDEISNIDEAIHIGRVSRSLKDVFRTSSLKTKEGRGLGLITSILLLRKYKLERDYFKLNIKENETRFTLTIPYLRITEKEEILIAEEVAKVIETIPMIPEHIRELEKRLRNPEVNFTEIEKIILTDPALSADIIRIANSPYYMTLNPVKTVLDAIKIIGIRGISSIISVSTSYKLLEEKAAKEKVIAIFNHSEETAFFAKQLASILNLEIDQDEVYIASLLHDIGKIVIEGLNPDLYEKIQQLFVEKNIPIEIIEDIAGGLNHAMVGYLLAEKWKFPSIIGEVIRCHHKPRDAQSNPKIVFLVYLANLFTYYVNNKIQYENIDINALEYFNLASKEKVEETVNTIFKNYTNFKKSFLI